MSWDGVVNQKLSQLKYPNKQQAKADIMSALQMFKDLRPEQKEFMFENGKTSNLLTLSGTIPVNFMNNTYNIPICVYLMIPHPFVPPLVYVTPTSNMVIKPGKHIDTRGRIYLPLLTEWRHPKDDIIGLINMLRVIFGEECPVYSRGPTVTQQHQTPYPQHSTGMPTPGRMPMPGGYPSSAGYPSTSYPSSGHHPPPYSAANTSSTPYPASTYGQQPAPYPNTRPPFTTEVPVGKAPERQESVIGDETIRLSLLSAVDEKLKRRIKEVFEMGRTEIEALQDKNQKLETGKIQLDECMTKLRQERNDVDSNITLLKQKNSEAEEAIKCMEDDAANLNIDDAVLTTAPLYNQILQVYAEEQAVEDAIYYLNDALRRDVIDIEVFLKVVRQCSRKQFILRATLQKARQAAGLKQI